MVFGMGVFANSEHIDLSRDFIHAIKFYFILLSGANNAIILEYDPDEKS
jgi:hypothetical protein